MLDKVSYVGQIFGNRKVIADTCTDEDWTKIGKKVPKESKAKFVLGQCLNCGAIAPAELSQLIKYSPKRCAICSNINNHSDMKSITNNYAFYKKYCVLNVQYKNETISAMIDLDDYERVSKHVWRASKKKNKYYLLTGSKSKDNVVYLHAFILDTEVPDGYEIDHKDGNSLNNRKKNLRVITRLENIQNSKVRIDNVIGIRGICKAGNKYKCDFVFNNKRYYFKSMNTIEEAVYCRKYAEQYFGLETLKNNPLAKQYLTLSKEDRKAIKRYVISIIESK